MPTDEPANDPSSIEIGDEVGRRVYGDGRVEEARWDELRWVRVLTLAEGPFAEDVFFVLAESEETGVVIPDSLGGEELVPRLQELPGFDNEALIRAMAETGESNAMLWSSAWRR